MVRRAITILTLFALTLYSSSAAASWLCYAMAADAIAATYCMNPSNPCCHGKCHVVRTTEKEQSGRSPATAVLTMKLVPFVLFTVEHPICVGPLSVRFPSWASTPLEGTAPEIEHPPQPIRRQI